MRLLTTLLLVLPIALMAQTTHPVEVGGSTLNPPDPYYSPANLTIQEGDIVRWTNASGSHNVNGRLIHFPANPEGFYSGVTRDGVWSYSFTFNTPGVYNYHCDSEGHATTQFGQITVISANGVAEQAGRLPVRVFPVPAENRLVVDVQDRFVVRMIILGVDGRTISETGIKGTQMLEVPIDQLPAGNYVLRLMQAEGAPEHVPFTKK